LKFFYQKKQSIKMKKTFLNFMNTLPNCLKAKSLITTSKRYSFVGIMMGIFFFCSIGTLFAQNPSAMFEVAAPNKGVLIPRVSLTSQDDISTIISPAISLLVYNTAAAGNSTNNVSPGFYYWNGIRWNSLGSSSGNNTSSITTFAEFYALMPGDNTVTIAAGSPIEFPRNGPTNGIITRINASQFNIPLVGIYLVRWKVTIAEAGQLILQLNGTDIASSVVGRATGENQIEGESMVTTTLPNMVLTLSNPSGNPVSLTLSQNAGGIRPVSANLIITRMQ
jgi:hypothetical protein